MQKQAFDRSGINDSLTPVPQYLEMLYRFRICEFADAADTAQGWVVAISEEHAHSILGDHAFLQCMPYRSSIDVAVGTVLLTNGKLTK